MDSLKSFLSPLSMGTGAIQDTLVGLRACLVRPRTYCYCCTETSRHWRHRRDRAPCFNVGLEWFCRLCVCPLWFLLPNIDISSKPSSSQRTSVKKTILMTGLSHSHTYKFTALKIYQQDYALAFKGESYTHIGIYKAKFGSATCLGTQQGI